MKERILEINPLCQVHIVDDFISNENVAALIKKNWGSNLSKFQGVQLPGGVMLNGQQIYNDAVEEIKALEEEIQSKYELPVDFYLN
jgi:hypothetical protein